MITKVINNNTYKLPGSLNPFQMKMYIHLINWKWNNISKKVGHYNYKGTKIPYDALLPDRYKTSLEILYPAIRNRVREHIKKFPFRIHIHFHHMASSQAANLNLFLPILLNNKVNDIFKMIKSDFQSLAVDFLDNGFRIEFWDEPNNNLGDKTTWSGTDTDIAIAYYNKKNELCLWLIEHKLTEAEFTQCGGAKSKNKKINKHRCDKNFSEICKDKNFCYYHDVRGFKYWEITSTNASFYPNHHLFKSCPFKDGLNQLWRNQLLGLSIEKDPRQPYKYVFFSVVKHPDNSFLDNSIMQYKQLINFHSKFSVIESSDFIAAAKNINDNNLNNWISWYKQLYNLH